MRLYLRVTRSPGTNEPVCGLLEVSYQLSSRNQGLAFQYHVSFVCVETRLEGLSYVRSEQRGEGEDGSVVIDLTK